YPDIRSVEQPDLGDRALMEFTISTDSVDRENDTISVEGWDLETYRRNPVVLWAHSRIDTPIGRAIEVGVRDGALRSTAEFDLDDPFATLVYRKLKRGFLNAVSVGFVPKEWTWDETRGGFNFLRQELVEYSVVPVPMNAE